MSGCDGCDGRDGDVKVRGAVRGGVVKGAVELISFSVASSTSIGFVIELIVSSPMSKCCGSVVVCCVAVGGCWSSGGKRGCVGTVVVALSNGNGGTFVIGVVGNGDVIGVSGTFVIGEGNSLSSIKTSLKSGSTYGCFSKGSSTESNVYINRKQVLFQVSPMCF